jgi:hypothetical protein
MVLPTPLVAHIARRVAGADGDGAVPLQVDRAVGAVAIQPTGVTLYRRRRA